MSPMRHVVLVVCLMCSCQCQRSFMRVATIPTASSATLVAVAYDEIRQVLYARDTSCNVYRVLGNGSLSTIASSICPEYVNGYGQAIVWNKNNPDFVYATDHGYVHAVNVRQGGSSRLCGDGGCGSTRDGVGTNARFSHPYGLVHHPTRNELFVVDDDYSRLRRVVIATRDVTTLGTWGFSAGNGMAFDETGDRLFVTAPRCIKVVNPISGSVADFSGACGTGGAVDGSSTASRFTELWGLTYLPLMKMLVVVDRGSHRIRGVRLDGSTTTLAGSTSGFQDGAASSSRFSFPTAIATASKRNSIVVLDRGNNRLRQLWVTTWTLSSSSTVATSKSTSGTTAVSSSSSISCTAPATASATVSNAQSSTPTLTSGLSQTASLAPSGTITRGLSSSASLSAALTVSTSASLVISATSTLKVSTTSTSSASVSRCPQSASLSASISRSPASTDSRSISRPLDSTSSSVTTNVSLTKSSTSSVSNLLTSSKSSTISASMLLTSSSSLTSSASVLLTSSKSSTNSASLSLTSSKSSTSSLLMSRSSSSSGSISSTVSRSWTQSASDTKTLTASSSASISCTVSTRTESVGSETVFLSPSRRTPTTSDATTRTATRSVLCAPELCRLSAPPPSWDNSTAGLGVVIALPSQTSTVSATLHSLVADLVSYDLATSPATTVLFFVDCPGYPLPLYARDVTTTSGAQVETSTVQHGSVTEFTLRLSNATAPPNGWLPADAFAFRTGNVIDVAMVVSCQGMQQLNLIVPVAPKLLPAIAAVAESVGSGLQWTSSVGGASSASSVGRVAASRRVLLCSIAEGSSGGLLGMSIVNDADDDDGTTAFARGAIVGNTVVLLCAAACLGIAAVVYTQYTLSGSYHVGLVRMALPSSLLPVWTALVQGVAGAVPLVILAGDAGYAFLGALTTLMPLCLVFWACHRARATLTCMKVVDTHKSSPIDSIIVDRIPQCCRAAHDLVRNKLRRRHRWWTVDNSPSTCEMRLMWVLLIEFRVLHYAVLDASVLILASVLGSLAGLGSLLQCRVVAGLIMTLYAAQLLVCVTVRPYTVPLFGWYAVVCLVCNCVNLAVQLASLSTGVNASPSSTVLLVTTSLEFMILGLAFGKQVLSDVLAMLVACLRVVRNAKAIRQTNRDKQQSSGLQICTTPNTVSIDGGGGGADEDDELLNTFMNRFDWCDEASSLLQQDNQSIIRTVALRCETLQCDDDMTIAVVPNVESLEQSVSCATMSCMDTSTSIFILDDMPGDVVDPLDVGSISRKRHMSLIDELEMLQLNHHDSVCRVEPPELRR